MVSIAQLAEGLLFSQEGLCCIDLIGSLCDLFCWMDGWIDGQTGGQVSLRTGHFVF